MNIRLFLLILMLFLLNGCSLFGTGSSSKTTDTRSSSFSNQDEKLRFFRAYVNELSPVQDAEYHIIYHDNSQGVPGPSDYAMEMVLKVDPAQIDKWTDGMTRVTSATPDLAWGYALLPGTPAWAVSGTPEVYQRGNGVTLAVFRKEGILFKRVTSM